MHYEERVIDGVLCWRESPNGAWLQKAPEQLTELRLAARQAPAKEPQLALVISHPDMGVYLGSCMGLGFWSKLDPAGQPSAVTFPSEAAAEAFMASWDSGRPDDACMVPVEPDDDGYASVAACVKAGLAGWEIPLASGLETGQALCLGSPPRG